MKFGATLGFGFYREKKDNYIGDEFVGKGLFSRKDVL